MSRNHFGTHPYHKLPNVTTAARAAAKAISATHRRGEALAVLFCLMLLMPALFAQIGQGTIRGRVTDTSGAVVPDVEIQIINIATNSTLRVASDSQGLYNMPNLPPGQYRVEASRTGFKTVVRTPIDVEPTQTAGVDLTLEVGAVSQSVTVTGAGPLLDVTTTNISAGLTTQQVEQLPLILSNEKRSITQLYANLPGLDTNTPTSNVTFDARMNGALVGQTEVFVDGGPSSEQISRGAIEENGPAVEAVSEFNVVENAFNAEYGGYGNWYTTINIKSGTNQLHGSVYDHWENRDLNAKPEFSPTTVPINQHEGGFTIGGPVVLPHIYNGRNRTFFFVNFDMLFSRGGPAGNLITVPTPAMVGGNFQGLVTSSGSMIPIFDPATQVPDGNGGVTAQQFSYNGQLNIIPPSRISQAAKIIGTYIPSPSLGFTGDINNFYDHRASTWPYFDTFVPLIKIDQSLSNRQKLSVLFTQQTRHRVLWGHPGEGLGPEPVWGQPQVNPLDWTTDQIADSWDLRINHDFVITNNLLNHFTVSADRYIGLAPDGTDGQDWDGKLGITGEPHDNGAFPAITFTGGTAAPNPFGRAYDENWHETDLAYLDTFTWNLGRHTMAFGGEAGMITISYLYPSGVAGSFTFENFTTSLPDSPNFGSWGSSFASMLLGDAYTASTLIPAETAARYPRYALFAQDDWRATPKLTFSYGLRWDYQPPFYELHNKLSSFEPNLANPGAGGLLGALAFPGQGYGNNFQTPWRKGFAPRVGIAYQFNNKTMVRTSFGIYYGETADQAGISNPLGFAATPSYTSANNYAPILNWNTQSFPAIPYPPPSTNPSFANGNTIYYIPKEGDREPENLDWSFDIERQLANNLSVDIGYLGNHAFHLPLSATTSSINYVPIKDLSVGSVLLDAINSPQAIAAGYTQPFPGFANQIGANTVAQALKPYPQYTSVSMSNVELPEGFARYHSLQIKATKRISNGLSALAFVTWSKQISNASSTGQVQYPGYVNATLDSAVPPVDFNVSWTYQLPFGQGQHFLGSSSAGVSRIISGWQINGNLNYNSGEPLLITASNDLAPLGYPALLANSVPSVKIHLNGRSGFNPATSKQLNPAAFSAPAAFTLGDTGGYLGNARGFTQKSESLQLGKETKIAERMGLKFSADFNNPFNLKRWIDTTTTNIQSSAFGTITSANPPRTIQLNANFSF